MKRSAKKPLSRDERILALRRDNHTHAEIAEIITQEYGPITKQWVRAIIERLTDGAGIKIALPSVRQPAPKRSPDLCRANKSCPNLRFENRAMCQEHLNAANENARLRREEARRDQRCIGPRVPGCTGVAELGYTTCGPCGAASAERSRNRKKIPGQCLSCKRPRLKGRNRLGRKFTRCRECYLSMGINPDKTADECISPFCTKPPKAGIARCDEHHAEWLASRGMAS